MANAHRGEIEAHLDGKPFTLCLTLGALAELEHAFGDDDMIALAARFENGCISATDCVRIVGAGLRGAGHDISDDVVATMRTERGATGFVDIVARLLSATFGVGAPQQAETSPEMDAEEREGCPFPWREVLSVGLGVLKLAPNILWAMTLPEFQAAVRGHSGDVGRGPSIARATFEDMMKKIS